MVGTEKINVLDVGVVALTFSLKFRMIGEIKLPVASDISKIKRLDESREPAGLKEKLTSKVLNAGLAHS